jgi:drug/metabolite transporter (DMT)-like permease
LRSRFLYGVRQLGSPSASLLSTLEPVVAVGLGVAVLGESLALAQAAGCALVLAAAAAAPTLSAQGAARVRSTESATALP